MFPKRLDPPGFEESAGGAPAGVVDGRENVGFAGVAVGAVLGVVEAPLLNKEFPVLAKSPPAGAAEVVAALCA